jgi:hypothetical protein
MITSIGEIQRTVTIMIDKQAKIMTANTIPKAISMIIVHPPDDLTKLGGIRTRRILPLGKWDHVKLDDVNQEFNVWLDKVQYEPLCENRRRATACSRSNRHPHTAMGMTLPARDEDWLQGSEDSCPLNAWLRSPESGAESPGKSGPSERAAVKIVRAGGPATP